jgi:hypothetical protein
MVNNTENHQPFGIANDYNTTFRKLDLLPSSGEGRETSALLSPIVRLALPKEPNRVGVSLPLSVDGSRCRSRNVLFPSRFVSMV